MSNKRIDLTQFEGITKGKWVYHEGEDRFMGKTVELHIPHPAVDGNPRVLNGMTQPIESAWPKKEDIKAMSLTPELIAELKKCYEEIDLVHRNLSIVRNALARGYPDIEEEIWKLIDASE